MKNDKYYIGIVSLEQLSALAPSCSFKDSFECVQELECQTAKMLNISDRSMVLVIRHPGGDWRQ